MSPNYIHTDIFLHWTSTSLQLVCLKNVISRLILYVFQHFSKIKPFQICQVNYTSYLI